MVPQTQSQVAALESDTPLCRALQQVRMLRDMSIAAAANAVSISEHDLVAIEAGSVHPDAAVVHSLAQLYGLNIERLGTERWVPRSAPRLDADEKVL